MHVIERVKLKLNFYECEENLNLENLPSINCKSSTHTNCKDKEFVRVYGSEKFKGLGQEGEWRAQTRKKAF